MIFGSCLGTVTSLTVMSMTMPTIMWGCWWRGCLTVQEYVPDLDASEIPSIPTTSAELVQKSQGQGFTRHSIAVVPELCLFHHPKSLFFCDVNFFTSCNTFQEYLVPVPYVILLFRIFSDMYTCTINNISMYSKFSLYF